MFLLFEHTTFLHDLKKTNLAADLTQPNDIKND